MTVAAYVDPNLIHYPLSAPYHPPCVYPEMPFLTGQFCDTSNQVYPAVRSTLHLLGLDQVHYGTPEWNPMGDILKPGYRVVLKPNLVQHDKGALAGLHCVTTHGSIIRAMLDYVYRAVGPTGHILIADAPVQGADFARLLEENGLNSIRDFYHDQLGYPLEIYDLRQGRALIEDRTNYYHGYIRLSGDPSGYVTIDLKDDSLLEPVSNSPFGVTDYDKQETTRRHCPGKHEYVIARSVLEADAIVSLPKLKTHEKVGITVCLKNTVGIVGSKDCLPHYRVNADEFAVRRRRLSRFVTQMRTIIRTSLPKAVWAPAHQLANKLYGRPGSSVPVVNTTPPIFVFGGAWSGNDTAWRMAVDLNRILLYSDSQGHVCDTPQRGYFALVDGIIGGQGEGPLLPGPRPTGALIAGTHPAETDIVAAAVMGFDWRRIPLIVEALTILNSPPVELRTTVPSVSTAERLSELMMPFVPPGGWLECLGQPTNQQGTPP